MNPQIIEPDQSQDRSLDSSKLSMSPAPQPQFAPPQNSGFQPVQPPESPPSKPKKSKKKLLAAGLLILIIIGGVFSYTLLKSDNKQADSPKPPVKQAKQETASQSLAEAQMKFGINMVKQLNDSDESVFISPASVSLALSMVYPGAQGETKAEMKQTMQLGDISDDELGSQNKSILDMLSNSDPKTKTSVANSVWVDKPDKTNNNFELKPDYKAMLTKYYDSESNLVDLQTGEAKDSINNWVKLKTQNKIPTLLNEKLPDGYRFMLINAIYFKGTWKYQFEKAATTDKEFTSSNGANHKVPTMEISEKLKYYKTDDAEVVELPYGENGEYVMDVVLPDKIDDFTRDVTYSSLSDLLKATKEKDGIVELPRFKLEYNKQLKKTLQALGMKKAFSDEGVDLSGISESPTKIDQVIHKTFVEVNEEGTEAAAVTAIGGMETTSVSEPTDNFYMKVNKPFFVMIRDTKTNIPLFMGVINNVN